MNYKIPNYSEDRSIDVGKSNLEKLKNSQGELKFTGVYIHLAPICNFNCCGCYVASQTKFRRLKSLVTINTDKVCYINPIGINKIHRLDYKTICRIIDFAKDREAKSIIFAGAGEPLLDPEFNKISNYIQNKGLQVVLFTNCTLIKDKNHAKKLLLRGPVIGKLYTMDEKKYDKMVNKKGAFKATMRGLNFLIEAKNELENKDKEIILGIESYITKVNKKDLCDVLRFCRKNKIIPYFEAFLEIGQSKDLIKELALTEEEFIKIFNELKNIDKKEFGIDISIKPWSRVYGQDPCFRATHMFSVRDNGDVYICVCTLRKMGNVYNNKDPYNSLEKIFDVKNKWLLNYLKCDLCSVRINPKFLKS